MPTRRRRRLGRIAALLTGLVTTWCLGCSAFEPLLDALAGGAKAAMVCGSEGGSFSTSTQTTSVVRDAANDDGSAAGIDCGCQGCYAPTPNLQQLTIIPTPPPAAVPADLDALPSVDRAPLVPPPQVLA